TPLEGDVAAQVTAAAQAAVPGGTIDRVETDNDGVYEAHVTKADGTHVIVQIGADYTVTGTIDQPQGGPGGRGGGPGAGETALEGDTATSVTAAAQAAVPDGTIVRVETDSDGSPYEAHVTKADGTEVVVKVDANFTVTATEAMPAGGPNGGHHQGPPPAGAATTGQASTTTG
ncbi:MAG: PepSY domain-containing protein, partial [Ilumatobacteraceae bacterium]